MFYNNASWSLLYGIDTTTFTIGNVDGDTNGRADVIVSFPGAGTWQFRNNSQWSQVHFISASEVTTSDLDINGQDDIVLSLPGYGLWVFGKRHNLDADPRFGCGSGRRRRTQLAVKCHATSSGWLAVVTAVLAVSIQTKTPSRG